MNYDDDGDLMMVASAHIAADGVMTLDSDKVFPWHIGTQVDAEVSARTVTLREKGSGLVIVTILCDRITDNRPNQEQLRTDATFWQITEWFKEESE